jgi:hypothetical protein
MRKSPTDADRIKRKELGVIQVLLERLNSRRLPYALELKEKVDHGEPLTEFDTRFLKKVIDEADEARRLAAKHPKYQHVVDEMSHLYDEITRKGLENEQKKADSG